MAVKKLDNFRGFGWFHVGDTWLTRVAILFRCQGVAPGLIKFWERRGGIGGSCSGAPAAIKLSLMTAMPVMLVVLCLMAIAYRYYSKFLATRVAVLDDARPTPAELKNDGQNFHPTNKWVLFGHHFAAISGAGPLIGPVLAAQFGYLPGLLWIVIGVCLAGAVQDFLMLAASIRRGGKSLAQIAYNDIGKVAGSASTVAILFIIIIALAGLGKVVVKALGGESVTFPAGSVLSGVGEAPAFGGTTAIDQIPGNSTLSWNSNQSSMTINEPFTLRVGKGTVSRVVGDKWSIQLGPATVRLMPGSAWGTFTIAATIPIALLVGLWMYKLRPGKIIEASLIGGALTLLATFVGAWVAENHELAALFNLTDKQVILAMAVYGFIASVLPVWVLLAPRDYLSSFLKIGTIALLVGGTIIANPKLEAPALNHIFLAGGPTVPGRIFPFLFITIMCGAISGFHALVSSGTTPKMIRKESEARMIGYGSMLIEGLVGVVAMIAAATLPVGDYYAMNTDLAKVPAFHDKFALIGANIDHLGGPTGYESLTKESLRGRTGGAVTLAVGMAHIFDGAARRFTPSAEHAMQVMWKYWYHFAIMFEALFILTTIDAGTRIGRFLLQEAAGKVIHPKFAQVDWLPGALLSTLLVVAAWAYFINANSMAAIWPMFGVANQMLAVIALAVISAYLANSGRAKYVWITLLPMMLVMTTTSTAAVYMLIGQKTTFVTQWNNATPDRTIMINSAVQGLLILGMLACGFIVIIGALIRISKTDVGSALADVAFPPSAKADPTSEMV
jgi:carbon starvation protein